MWKKIKENCGVKIYNLGTGKGSSVLDVVHAYEKACGKKIPYEIKPRRAGDLDELYSQCDKAEKELHWTAKYDLNDMCADSWKWQSMNPKQQTIDISGADTNKKALSLEKFF